MSSVDPLSDARSAERRRSISRGQISCGHRAKGYAREAGDLDCSKSVVASVGIDALVYWYS